MAKNKDSETSKILLLLKLNANRVFDRIQLRMPEYLDDFAMKRTRKFFPEVFNHKFDGIQLETLAKAETETLIALENYFNKVDDVKWYMDHTEDMPNSVHDKLKHHLKDLSKLLETLNLYLDAELGIAADKADTDEEDDIPSLKDL